MNQGNKPNKKNIKPEGKKDLNLQLDLFTDEEPPVPEVKPIYQKHKDIPIW